MMPPLHDTPLTAIDVALQVCLAHAAPLAAETIALEHALGRTLAVDLRADLDQPPFDRSAMDGVAVRSEDLQQLPITLVQIGAALAGQPFDGVIGAGQCVRIMTGAVVPAGADAVVPVERILVAARDGVTTVTLSQPVKPEQHLARRGSEVRAGDVVLSAGTQLTAARLGVAAAFGHAQVQVRRRPKVALLPTGDELVPIDTVPGPGQIRDSNRYTLAAVLQSAGAEVVQLPVAADDPQRLRDALTHAWTVADVVVTCGGVSAGDLDLVAPTLQALGATAHLHKIAIKPGKPFLFASRGAQLALGLPGNPVSSLVCALLFAVPVLRKLQGQSIDGWTVVQLPVAAGFPAVGPRAEVSPVRLQPWHDGAMPRMAVAAIATQGSADLPAFARADALTLRPAGHGALQAGDLVDVLWLPQLA